MCDLPQALNTAMLKFSPDGKETESKVTYGEEFWSILHEHNKHQSDIDEH